jgi:heme oxygenase (biliverdin-IX-beta and delta-forming)
MRDLDSSISMATTAGLAVTLRRATADIHQAVERLPIMTRLTSPTVTRDDYLEYLRVLADVYSALEATLLASLDKELRNELGLRRKLPAILDDLASHGRAHVPRGPSSIVPREAGAALGGVYVLEGATLGGRVIAKHLRRCIGPALGPTAFLDFYGQEASASWKRFTGTLDRLAADGLLDPAEVVSGARTTFSLVHRILGNDESLRMTDPTSIGSETR